MSISGKVEGLVLSMEAEANLIAESHGYPAALDFVDQVASNLDSIRDDLYERMEEEEEEVGDEKDHSRKSS